jgi:hypothetical protein
MKKNKIRDFIKENKSLDFESGETDFNQLSKYKRRIQSEEYFKFIIDSNNAGFFYGHALQIYSYSSLHAYQDIEAINSLLTEELGYIFEGLIAFAEDLFGTQFCFDLKTGGIIFFETETGKRTPIASNFEKWLDLINEKSSYFTGVNILKQWQSEHDLAFDQRLCPKKPFIMGGDFRIENLYAGTFPVFLKAYANIARQVFNLPDGTAVKLVIKNDVNM